MIWVIAMKKIVIKSIDRPSVNKPDYLISWFCEAFGLSNTDDKNTIEAQLLKSFLIAAQKRGITKLRTQEKTFIGKRDPHLVIIGRLDCPSR